MKEKKQSFSEAAEQVLKEGYKEGLACKDIARIAIEKGYIDPVGKTPNFSISLAIRRSIKNLGESSPFVQTGPNIFCYREPQTTLQVSVNKKNVKKRGPKKRKVKDKDEKEDPTFTPKNNTKKEPVKREITEIKKEIPLVKSEMKFRDAAELVLKDYKDGLSPKMIVKEAIDRGYVKSFGKTPHGTMSSVITRDIREKGSKSPFESLGNGTFRLKSRDFQENETKRVKLSPSVEQNEESELTDTLEIEKEDTSDLKEEKNEITVEIKEITQEEEGDERDFQEVWNLIEKESEALNHLLTTSSNK